MGRKSQRKMTGQSLEERIERGRTRDRTDELLSSLDGEKLGELIHNEEFRVRLEQAIKEYREGRLDIWEAKRMIAEEMKRRAEQNPDI